MTLLLQIVAAAVAVLTVSVLIRDGATLRRGAAVQIAIAAIAAAVACQPAYSVARDAFWAGNADRSEPSASIVVAGRAGGIDVDRINRLAADIPRRDTFAMVPELDPNSLEYQWLTYQMLPRRLTDAERADHLVFYEVEPSEAAYDRRAFGPPRMITPNVGVAERQDAR